jgi:hypothetical protein
MDDFVRRFGQQDSSGAFFLDSSRQSIIVSLLSAGTFVYVSLLTATTLNSTNFERLVVR